MLDHGHANALLSGVYRLVEWFGLKRAGASHSIRISSADVLAESGLLSPLRRVPGMAIPRYPGTARDTPRWG